LQVGDTMADPLEPTCEACGVPYVEHLGLIGTCNRLQRALKLLEEVCSWHRDQDSQDYNECDKEPCQFCVWVSELRAGNDNVKQGLTCLRRKRHTN
jgi:hypothetical protein